MSIHQDPAPQSNRCYKINIHHNILGEREFNFFVDDWWDRAYGQSWMWSENNPAAMWFAMRTAGAGNLITDDEVLYGKIEGLGVLVHVSELGLEVL